MKAIVSLIAAGAILFSVAHFVSAQKTHVLADPNEANWGPAPPMLPPGAQIAILFGDPAKAGAYAVRLKFPSNYAIPAHSHPTDENVVVVSGAVIFGMGNTLIKTAPSNKTLPAGGFAQMPAGVNHFAYTNDESTIVLFGQGPVEFKYVNPSDDPRAKRTSQQ